MIGRNQPTLFAHASKQLTILKDPLDVQSVSGTCLVISTTFEVTCKLPGPCVIDETRVALTDRILRANEDNRYVGNVRVVLRHLGVERVDGVEAHLVFQTEDEDHRIDPVCELAAPQCTETVSIRY